MLALEAGLAIGGHDEYRRWQLFLLSDPTITPEQARPLPLGSLTLTQTPLLNLKNVAYVVQTSGEVGLGPGLAYSSKLKSDLEVSVQGLPFVVVADDVRVYMGTFTTAISSISPMGPWVMLEDITADNFTIQPSMTDAHHSRLDEPILKVLTETGKLVP
jgi:hypothetical protein